MAIQAGDIRRTTGGDQFGQFLVALSPNGERMASSSEDGAVQVWEASTGEHLLTLGARATPVAWSPDSLQLASGNADGSVDILRAA